MDIKSLLTILQVFLATGNLVIMLYALKKFLGKPQDTLAARIAALEVRLTALEVKEQEHVQEIQRSLQLGNDEFRITKETNKVLQTCMLALIEFELSYCASTSYKGDISDLEEAKKALHEHLARK